MRWRRFGCLGGEQRFGLPPASVRRLIGSGQCIPVRYNSGPLLGIRSEFQPGELRLAGSCLGCGFRKLGSNLDERLTGGGEQLPPSALDVGDRSGSGASVVCSLGGICCRPKPDAAEPDRVDVLFGIGEVPQCLRYGQLSSRVVPLCGGEFGEVAWRQLSEMGSFSCPTMRRAALASSLASSTCPRLMWIRPSTSCR